MTQFSKNTLLIAVLLIMSLNGGVLLAKELTIPFQPISNNSSGDDFAPSFNAAGDVMVFGSRRNGSKYQNIYISQRRSDGSWQPARQLDEINSRFDDETPFLSPDGKLLIFASNRDGSLESRGRNPGQIQVSFDLYWSRNVNGSWTKPGKLPGEVNTTQNERSAAFDPDSGWLYYTAWPFGDVSQARILRARYSGGLFSAGTPLPQSINAGFREMGPVLSDGGLYFSSARPGGYGGQDIYFVPIKGDGFGDVQALDGTVNTTAHEMFYHKINEEAYLTSNRKGGYGRYDIFSRSAPPRQLNFMVRDGRSKEGVLAEADISAELKQGENEHRETLKKTTAQDGRFNLQYHPALKTVEISIEQKGYLPFQRELKLAELDSEQNYLDLVPLATDGGFDLHAINFDYNSARLKSESLSYLKSLVKYLEGNRHRYLITGHTDEHGSEKFNQQLSLERANAVRDYLVTAGLNRERFETAGAGESRPLRTDSGEEADRLNRRTEFSLIKQ